MSLDVLHSCAQDKKATSKSYFFKETIKIRQFNHDRNCITTVTTPRRKQTSIKWHQHSPGWHSVLIAHLYVKTFLVI